MKESLSKMVENLERKNKEVELYKANYKAIGQLLFFALKHDWAKEIIETSNLNLGFEEECTQEVIEAYIKYIKKFEQRLRVSKIIEKLDDPLDKAIIVSEILGK